MNHKRSKNYKNVWLKSEKNNGNIIKYKKQQYKIACEQCESILDRKTFIKINSDFNKEEKIYLRHLNKE